jgi:hypothetical protein
MFVLHTSITMEIIHRGRFTETCFDKFENVTITEWICPKADVLFGEYNWMNKGQTIVETFNLVLRRIKDSEFEELVIDYYWFGAELFFFNSGSLIINCDNKENLRLIADDEDTREFVSPGWEMSGSYEITIEDLRKVCNAEKIEIRVSEERYSFELEGKGLLKFQLMCRSFLSEVFNEKLHDDWVNSLLQE